MSNLQTNNQPQAQVAHSHPTMKTFINVGIILAVVTAVEFGIIYIEGIRGIVIALLVILSIFKFYMVASYFMHLKFDHKLLSWAFVVGVLLATAIAIAQKFINLT